jgi:predicted ribonuclease YlaK
MKGLTIPESYILIDEAEDLDLKTLKLIGSRIGKDSNIVFCGDYKQAEGKFIQDNGLLQLIEGTKGNPLVGIVVLDDDVRSSASKVFANLE